MSLRTPTSFSFLALTATAAAQTLSPSAFYLTREGDSSLPYGFSQPSRFQQIDAGIVGGPLVIQALVFRRDGSANGAPHAAVAPKSVTLTITIGDGVACSAATANFANNYVGAPTVAFAGTISTPAAWQTPARASPTPWDFRLPVTPSVWLGPASLVWEIHTTSTSDNTRVNLDGAQPAFSLFSWCGYEMQGVGCSTSNGEFAARGSGQTIGAPVQAFTVAIDVTGAPAAANATWLIGFGVVGASVPGLCTTFWPDPIASISGTADATGTWEPFFQTPNNPMWLGFPLQMQVAAPDPSAPSGIPLTLSNGLTYRIEPLAPAFSACSVVAASGTATTGTVLQRVMVVEFE